METLLTLPHALILAIISAIFFTGIYVFMIKDTAASLKELKLSVKENDAKTNEKLDSLAITLNSIQIEQKYQSKINEREFDFLRSELAGVIIRVTTLENERKEYNAKNH